MARQLDTRINAGVQLYRKSRGQPNTLCFVGTALMENCNGLVADGRLTRAAGWTGNNVPATCKAKSIAYGFARCLEHTVRTKRTTYRGIVNETGA